MINKDVLEFKFRVGVWRVKFSVPPCRPGQPLRIVAEWDPGGFPGLDKLTPADRATYEREKQAILTQCEKMLGRGQLKYDIAHKVL